MENYGWALNSDERAAFKLRALYKKYGYTQYRMSKFEEYDLYARNKDFLVSDNVITFTDTDGKLLALKPDVTLSIIKSNKESANGLSKVYYNEHVYRVSKGTQSFKEIMQVGLECIGDVDGYVVTEVLSLAAKSLDLISDNNVLDLSDLSLVKSVIENAGVSFSGEEKIISFLGEKNVEGVRSVLREENIDVKKASVVEKLVTVYGAPNKVLKELDCFKVNDTAERAVENLKGLTDSLTAIGMGDKIRIDFSVINDINYYNGVVFKGFVSGIPTGILSGGQYDNLMNKMGKSACAIGFAVYLDEIENFVKDMEEYDVDVLVVYDDSVSAKDISVKVNEIVSGGETALAKKAVPERLKYKRLVELKGECE